MRAAGQEEGEEEGGEEGEEVGQEEGPEGRGHRVLNELVVQLVERPVQDAVV